MTLNTDLFVKGKRFSQEFSFDETAAQVLPKTGEGSAILAAISSYVGSNASKVSVSGTAPTPFGPGHLWFDNETVGRLLVWTGLQWVDASPGVQNTTQQGVTVGANPPASPKEGWLWFDNGDTYRMYIWNGLQWIDANPASVNFDSVALTGTPTAPTAAVGTNTTQIASTAFVQTATSFTQAGTGAVSRTAQDKMRETVSVKDFGAVGDGVADDTAAIQRALNGGVRVYVPSGTYKVTGALFVSSSAGAPRNLILHGDSAASVIAFSGGAYLSLSKSNYSSDFVLRDLSFTSDGNAATKVVFSVARGEVRNCTFNGFVLGLEVNQAYQLIQHNTFIDCTTGIKNIDRADVSGAYYNANAINNNFFAQCETGIALQHTDVVVGPGSVVLNPVALHQNTFENCSTVGIRLSWVNNITIDCCYFENTPINIFADLFSQNLLVQNIHSHPTEVSVKLNNSFANVSGGRIKNYVLENGSALTEIAPRQGALEGVSIDSTSTYTPSTTTGTWVPTLTGGSVAGTTTYTAQFGTYVRQGNLVTATFNAAYSATTGSGDLLISLPFKVKNQTGLRFVGAVQTTSYNLSEAAGSLSLFASSNNTTMTIVLSRDDLASVAQPITNESCQFFGTITYITDAV